MRYITTQPISFWRRTGRHTRKMGIHNPVFHFSNPSPPLKLTPYQTTLVATPNISHGAPTHTRLALNINAILLQTRAAVESKDKRVHASADAGVKHRHCPRWSLMRHQRSGSCTPPNTTHINTHTCTHRFKIGRFSYSSEGRGTAAMSYKRQTTKKKILNIKKMPTTAALSK